MIPLPALGWSITEAIAAVGTIKRLWDSFFHPYDNAPKRLQELRNSLDVAQAWLSRVLIVEEPQEQSPSLYGALDALRQTIHECKDYLDRNAALLEDQGPSGTPAALEWAVRRAGQTVRFTFGGRARKLTDDLGMNMQQIALVYAELTL
jgi:hypothetical protein